MAATRRIKPGRSLAENARILIPDLLDAFLARKDRVTRHPRLKSELHKMRIQGKRVRYAMEAVAPAFGSSFVECLGEVKEMLDLMGTVHDCDVHVPRLVAYLEEIRAFNRRRPASADRIATAALSRFVREQMLLRQRCFVAIVEKLKTWNSEGLKERVANAMH
jgi:CHAD domain-containing protein